ncbi:DUF5672 family protein [Flavobacterium sp. AG291]|uniref:DUF5672 family protein n=1 Tax=Flavobacterium sp. AG291 TaxID=2184000 RepID=UPI000E0BF040|nr:DUF5672 family protein [Flavobacterium sp. AG291]RDI05777.1 hypothetical protein DEU42_11531 [Flavobacterium sp. AG291]
MKKAIVVVPIYKTNLDDNEMLSLKRSVKMLHQHPFAIACPEHLDITPLNSILAPVHYTIHRFEDSYFKGIAGYNKLMLSEVFYNSFNEYEYLLICQTDVFVFDDQLEYWCSKGYDYIGAPWIASKQTAITKLLLNINNSFKKKKKRTEHFFKVGNGGFSLRKVSTMQRIVNEQKDNIEYCLANPNDLSHHIEDVYFSLVAPALTEMKIPAYTEAVGFAMDRKPDIAYKLNGKKLPFASHRFYNRKVKEFWTPIIDKMQKAG